MWETTLPKSGTIWILGFSTVCIGGLKTPKLIGWVKNHLERMKHFLSQEEEPERGEREHNESHGLFYLISDLITFVL